MTTMARSPYCIRTLYVLYLMMKMKEREEREKKMFKCNITTYSFTPYTGKISILYKNINICDYMCPPISIDFTLPVIE